MMRYLLLGVVGVAASAQAVSAQNVVHGRQLFLQDGCYECHGTVGQGGQSGPRIAPGAPSASAIIAYIRRPAGVMPPYSPAVISDSGIADIQAYLAQIKKPNAKIPE